MTAGLLRLIPAGIALTVVLSACGGTGASGSGASSTSSPSSSGTPTPPASAGTLSLAASTYEVAAHATAVTVSVDRSGGSWGAASVRYATHFGTALDGINYGNANGVLSWANGDASPKSFTVPILASSFSGPRTLSVELSQPTGASLGAVATASIVLTGSTSLSANARSIRAWTSCDGTSDDAAGVARAFTAARDGAFSLLVDCPVRIHTGSDIARPIFIDNGTTVQFSAAGKFILDNSLIPAFVIADSTDINLEGWNIEYQGGISTDPHARAYLNGALMSNGSVKPGNAFNDVALTDWLAAHRGIRFENEVKSNWSGSTNACALIFITGDSARVKIDHMQVAVPANAGVQSFVPVVFTLSQNFKANQTVGPGTPMTSAHVALPHQLTFSNISLDGTYMGWVGNAQDLTITQVSSLRYGDLEDAHGHNVGGVTKWFAPPHLIYLSYSASSDPLLVNARVSISNVSDQGQRVGSARDKGHGDSTSGYALSLKIACSSCSVDSYSSARPDGMLDVMTSSDLSITNMTGSYDSSFLNDVYPGWRFPSAPYHNLTFKNVSIEDTAAQSVQAPIGNAGMASNRGMYFSEVSATVKAWAGPGMLPLPSISGSGKAVSLNVLETQRKLRIGRAETDVVLATLQASPSTVSAGGTTQLTWASQGAKECAASGAWSGTLQPSGSKQVPVGGAGNYNFVIICSSDQDASTPAVALVAAQ
ncbi:MAG TPA: hypothetical protein VKT22_15795 [Steroidobacteraceae bacterium]|nr:hypothetical protein [Steroidobacteraceae bacterium]